MATEHVEKWPPANGLSTPTVPREDAVLTTYTSIVIKAPASRAFQVVCETSSYPSWNSFVPTAIVHSQPPGVPQESTLLCNGTCFTFNVVMDAKKPHKITPTQLLVTDVSTPQHQSNYISQQMLQNDSTYTRDLSKTYRISWKSVGPFVTLGLRTERFHEIIAQGDDECLLRTWEVMGGAIAHTVKWMYRKSLSNNFQLWGEDVKKASEDGPCENDDLTV